jgi:hypothetical protein
LYAAIAMPVIYFGTQLVAAPFYPMAVFAPIPSESETTAMIAGSWRALKRRSHPKFSMNIIDRISLGLCCFNFALTLAVKQAHGLPLYDGL